MCLSKRLPIRNLRVDSIWDNTVTLLKEALIATEAFGEVYTDQRTAILSLKVRNEGMSWIVGVAAVLYMNGEETRSLHKYPSLGTEDGHTAFEAELVGVVMGTRMTSEHIAEL